MTYGYAPVSKADRDDKNLKVHLHTGNTIVVVSQDWLNRNFDRSGYLGGSDLTGTIEPTKLQRLTCVRRRAD